MAARGCRIVLAVAAVVLMAALARAGGPYGLAKAWAVGVAVFVER